MRWLLNFLWILTSFACSGPQKPESPPQNPRVEWSPPKRLNGNWFFAGQHASSWARIPFQDIAIPDFVLLDSLWKAIRARNDSIWVLSATDFADTVMLPPFPWPGAGCQQVVDLPLLLFPSRPVQMDTFPFQIHIQTRTHRDTAWREASRWAGLFWITLAGDSLRPPGCPQETRLPDSSFLWSGAVCFGEFDPLSGESLSIRLILLGGGGAAGSPWTVGLWGAGWRWRGEVQESWTLQWGDLQRDFIIEMGGIPCEGNLRIRASVKRGTTLLRDTLLLFHLLPYPGSERFGPRRLRLWENLPALGDTLLLHAAVNQVEKETLWIFPRGALIPVETLASVSSEPVALFGLTRTGVLAQRWTQEGLFLERWEWDGTVDTLARIPDTLLFPPYTTYDAEDPDVGIGVRIPPGGGDTLMFVVFHPAGSTVETLDVGMEATTMVDLVDLPVPHRWRAVFHIAERDRSELWTLDLRWDGEHLIADTLRKLAEWGGDVPPIQAFAAPDTGQDRWAISWSSCAVELHQGDQRITVRHCPAFRKILYCSLWRRQIKCWGACLARGV